VYIISSAYEENIKHTAEYAEAMSSESN